MSAAGPAPEDRAPRDASSDADRALADHLDALDRGLAPDRAALLRAHPALATHFDADDAVQRRLRPALERASAPPRSFGAYEIEEEIARGGMGVVYRARHRTLGRLVALKTLRGDLFPTADDLARFRVETEAVAALDHPGIVPIYEVGEDHGRPWFAMRLAEGGNLAAAAPRFRGDFRAIAALLEEIARAVDHGHRHGILHRDLKPANVLLDSTGRALVADFGLAKRTRPPDAGDGSAPSHATPDVPTLSGVAVGTPVYMAPEQARGAGRGEVTTASDVWSLGVILYELLTGTRPFAGDDPAQVARSVTHDEPRAPRAVDPRVPRDLETVCLACVRKEPARRYANAGALADDLGRFLRGEPIRARRVGAAERLLLWAKRKPAAAGLAAASLLAIAAAGAAGAAALEARDAGRKTRSRVLIEQARASAEAGDAPRAALFFAEARLHDDSALARAGLRAHEAPIPVDVLQVPGAKAIWRVAYSPDETRLAAAADEGSVWVFDLRGGSAPRELAFGDARIHGLAWLPGGEALAIGDADGTLAVLDAASGREIHRLPGAGKFHAAWCVAVVPAAEGPLVAAGTEDGCVRIWDPAAGSTRDVAFDRVDPRPATHVQVKTLVPRPGTDVVLVAATYRLGDSAEPGEVRLLRVDAIESGGAFLPGVWNHDGPVWSADWSADGATALTADQHGVRGWSADGELLWRQPLAVPVGAVAAAPGGRAMSGSADGVARAFDAFSGRAVGAPLLHGREVFSLSVAPRTGHVAVAGRSPFVRVWRLPEGAPRHVSFQGPWHVQQIAFSPAEDALLAVLDDERLAVFDLDAGTVRTAAEPAAARAVATSARGWWVGAKGPQRRDVFELRREGGDLARVHVATLACEPNGLDLHPAAGLALTHEESPWRVRIWSLRPEPGNEAPAAASAGPAPATFVHVREFPGAFARSASPSAGLVAVGDAATVRLLDLGGARERWVRPAPEGLTSVHVSPAGDRIALRGLTVSLWDTASGRAAGSVPTRGGAGPTAFSPDGRILATGGADGRVAFFAAEDADPIGPVLAHAQDTRSGQGPDAVVGFRWSPSGRLLAVACASGTLHVWEVAWSRALDAPGLSVEDARIRAQLAAGRAIDEHGLDEPLAPDAWRSLRAAWRDRTGE